VGCGTGQITGWLAARVKPGRVMAADFSPAMLAQARGRGLHADFVLLDICRDGPVRRRFDVVLCFHSFLHFRDPPTQTAAQAAHDGLAAAVTLPDELRGALVGKRVLTSGV